MNTDDRNQTTTWTPSLTERAQLGLYLTSVGWLRRHRIRQELKSDALDPATHGGSLDSALDVLGTPRDLAAAHAEADTHHGFVHHAAALWALVAFAAMQVIGIAVGFRRGADAAAADRPVSYAIEIVSGLGPYTGSYVPDPAGAEFTLLTPAHLVVVLVAALLGGRSWRLFTRR